MLLPRTPSALYAGGTPAGPLLDRRNPKIDGVGPGFPGDPVPPDRLSPHDHDVSPVTNGNRCR